MLCSGVRVTRWFGKPILFSGHCGSLTSVHIFRAYLYWRIKFWEDQREQDKETGYKRQLPGEWRSNSGLPCKRLDDALPCLFVVGAHQSCPAHIPWYLLVQDAWLPAASNRDSVPFFLATEPPSVHEPGWKESAVSLGAEFQSLTDWIRISG